MRTTLLVILAALTTGITITTSVTPQLSLGTNLSVLFIILATTAASMILSYGIKDLKTLGRNLVGIIKAKQLKPEEVITQISGIQKLTKQQHLELAAEGDFHPFIIDGVKHLKYIQNAPAIKETMNQDISERKNRHAHDLTKMTLIGKLPMQLSFVVALVMALPLFFETQTTPNLAQLFTLPLVTILNGFLLSHFGVQPFTNRVHHIFNKDIEIRKMIARGIHLIADEKYPQEIEHSLQVHVKPSQREGQFEFKIQMAEPPALPQEVKLQKAK